MAVPSAVMTPHMEDITLTYHTGSVNIKLAYHDGLLHMNTSLCALCVVNEQLMPTKGVGVLTGRAQLNCRRGALHNNSLIHHVEKNPELRDRQ